MTIDLLSLFGSSCRRSMKAWRRAQSSIGRNVWLGRGTRAKKALTAGRVAIGECEIKVTRNINKIITEVV